MDPQDIIRELRKFYTEAENGRFARLLPAFERAVEQALRAMNGGKCHMKKIRSLAVLTGFSETGEKLMEVSLSLDVYYDGLHKVLDCAEYRRAKNIRKVEGVLYGSDGKWFDRFVNVYDEAGVLRDARTQSADGTVMVIDLGGNGNTGGS